MKKKMIVTGKKEEAKSENLLDIVYGKRESKFSKFVSRDEYRGHLYNMGHIDICNELLRLNSYPSTDKKLCIERCLAIYDRVHSTKKTLPEIKPTKSDRLEDLIK